MFYLNTIMSTNGEMSISWIWGGSTVRFFMFATKIKNAHAAHTRPYVFYWPQIDSYTARAYRGYLVEAAEGRSEIGGVESALVFPTHGYSGSYAMELSWAGGQSRNDFTDEYMMWPMHTACETVGQRGWFGQIPDIYYGPGSTLLPQGAMTSGKEWVRVGDLWLPWDGSSTPMTS
jgi:hypothetical protein